MPIAGCVAKGHINLDFEVHADVLGTSERMANQASTRTLIETIVEDHGSGNGPLGDHIYPQTVGLPRRPCW